MIKFSNIASIFAGATASRVSRISPLLFPNISSNSFVSFHPTTHVLLNANITSKHFLILLISSLVSVMLSSR